MQDVTVANVAHHHSRTVRVWRRSGARPVSFAHGLTIVAVILLSSSPVAAQGSYPGEHWKKARRPEALGWSAVKLQKAREHAESIGSAAVMIVADGTVLDEWGDTARRFQAHSMRKSLLNAIFGIHVHEGEIDLDATLEELGVDDNQPLTPSEKRATVRDLLEGRSGVYIPALSLGGSFWNPPRGSHPPGSFFQYNNWDFNALGTIFESRTGTRIFEELKRRIADPLQMQDFSVDDCEYFRGSHDDNIDTRHPGYPMRISARDLARFGLLILRRGRWRDRQIVPADWIASSLKPRSVYYAEHTRFGFATWRTYLRGKILPGGYTLPEEVHWTSGVNIQKVYVVPCLNLVLVHLFNTDLPLPRPSAEEVDRLLALVLEARIDDLGGALIEAASRGETDVAAALLQAGADLQARDEQRQTALHRAVLNGHGETVRLLLESGADVEAREILGTTALGLAVREGDPNMVGLVLTHGANAHVRNDFDGQTPLMWASSLGNDLIVKQLLKAGADPEARGMEVGETPLMLAAVGGNPGSVRALLEAGANADARSTNGRSAVMMAETLGHSDVVDILVNSGVSRERSVALLPLRAYLPDGAVSAAERGELRNPDVARAMLSRSAAVATEGESALVHAALAGNVEEVRLQLESGADINSTIADDWSALLVAAALGRTKVVKVLLREGADADARERRMGMSALIWAAWAGHAATVKALLEGGAGVDLQDRYGGSALTRAAAAGRSDVVDLLLKAGAKTGIGENDGSTALILAAAGGHTSIVRALLTAGAQVDARGADGVTALMTAVMADEEEAARAIVKAGADTGLKDAFGSTALDTAITLGREAIAGLLRRGSGTN